MIVLKYKQTKRQKKHDIEKCRSYKVAGCTNNPQYIFMGTIPSLEGQNIGFYYMAAGNCFWEFLENIISKKNNKKRYINYKNEYDDYHNPESKKYLDMTCINNINNQLKKDKIALLDTIKACYRINGLDSGILYQILQDKGDIEQLVNAKSKIIFTSDEAFKNFKKIVGKENIDNYHYCTVKSPSKQVTKDPQKKEETLRDWKDKI